MGETGLEIAVIGMSGRFPGAKNLDEFWENLKNGVESLWFYNEEELENAGIEPGLYKLSNYIKVAGGLLENIEYFDANFFDYVPNEAIIMDPQVRIFHETAWEALENAGYNPHSYQGKIGLYAGVSTGAHWGNLVAQSGRADETGSFAAILLASSNFLSTRVAYKLNLKGPTFILHSACSTSLAAIDQASRSILTGESNMALAGGVCVTAVRRKGYLYKEGMVRAADGHCRAFDANARGTVFGEGVGIVLLKLLEEAIADKDNIHALIKGSAVNNDGNRKLGYTAPSIEGQAEVIRAAVLMAEIQPHTITYVEANGTCTPLGDPVEIEALKQGFGTDKKGFCKIGAIKPNIGYLDAAAGAAAFIKVVLALKYRQIPPTLNFHTPNPKIDFENTPFRINTTLIQWNHDTNKHPLRAGINSFGIGGTNVHVILEEPPRGTRGLAPLTLDPLPETTDDRRQGQPGGVSAVSPPGPSRENQLILLSAKTPTALETMKKNLADYLKKYPGINLTDAAYTLQVGRKSFNHRWMVICTQVKETIDALTSPAGGETHAISPGEERPIIEKPQPGTTLNKDSLARIGGLWLQGHEIDWTGIYTREKPHRVPLPTYPFERQRYWVEGTGQAGDRPQPGKKAVPSKPAREKPDMEMVYPRYPRYPRPQLPTPYEAPKNEVQKVLERIWKKIFGYEQIGIRDDFLKLGGDSLKAITLVSMINSRLEVNVPLTGIFTMRTIEELSRFIREAEKEKVTSIQPVEKKEVYGLSIHQQRLWIIHHKEPGTSAFNILGIIPINRVIEPDILKQSLRELAARHESLRTGFKPVSGRAVQFIKEQVTVPFQEVDISHLPEEEIEPERKKIRYSHIMAPFDLSIPPLIRVMLLKWKESSWDLVFSVHHLISDGWSHEILQNDLMLCYQALQAKKPIEWEPLPLCYKDFAAWQNKQIHTPGIKEKSHRYWKQKLSAGVPAVDLPVDYPTGSQDSKGAGYICMIDAGIKNRLHHTAGQHDTTLFMVIFSTFLLILSDFSQQEDIACSIIEAGRKEAAIQQVVGFFVNSIPFTTRVKPGQSFEQFLKRINREVLEAFQHSSCPVEYVFEELDMKYPTLPVSFNMLSMMQTGSGTRQETFTPIHVPQTQDVKFDIEIYITEYSTSIEMKWMYRKNLFAPETISHIAAEYLKACEYFVHNPGMSLKDFRRTGKKRQFKKSTPSFLTGVNPGDNHPKGRFHKEK